jgi:hypothetical protein
LFNRAIDTQVHVFILFSGAVNHSSMDALWGPESKFQTASFYRSRKDEMLGC